MATLGQILRTARERRGATPSQAAAATRIKMQHIEAMESDQFQRIPAPTYAKGFLRMYAEYLGLDPAPLVRQYMESHMPRSRPSITPADDAPRPARAARAAAPVDEPPPAVESAAPARPAAPGFGPAWRTFSAALASAWAAFRPALVRVPWRVVGAVAVLAVATLAVSRVLATRGRADPAGVVVTAAEPVRLADDVPALIREPPEPYLEARPAGRRAP
jgi:cytoskeleton protein RodZ